MVLKFIKKTHILNSRNPGQSISMLGNISEGFGYPSWRFLDNTNHFIFIYNEPYFQMQRLESQFNLLMVSLHVILNLFAYTLK